MKKVLIFLSFICSFTYGQKTTDLFMPSNGVLRSPRGGYFGTSTTTDTTTFSAPIINAGEGTAAARKLGVLMANVSANANIIGSGSYFSPIAGNYYSYVTNPAIIYFESSAMYFGTKTGVSAPGTFTPNWKMNVQDAGVMVGSSGVPTSKLHLAGGTATAGTAPLKFTSGTNLTTPEAGTVEYSSNVFYMTPNTHRNFWWEGGGVFNARGDDDATRTKYSYSGIDYSNTTSYQMVGANSNLTIGSGSGSGDITLNVASGSGSFIFVAGLPTSCSGVPTGALANVAGVLTVCP